ncbi:hypothetical protein EDD16DRAFT_561612 [Pisolithus croceorrhizus]|nr:hypothetical protein EDD16DRAFT_561612 [Pisolithus croceorrhizus]KAI6106298.1 hypothetical protein EV401DRAFT_567171 [Pisolithus croceorrhizus]
MSLHYLLVAHSLIISFRHQSLWCEKFRQKAIGPHVVNVRHAGHWSLKTIVSGTNTLQDVPRPTGDIRTRDISQCPISTLWIDIMLGRPGP